MRSIGWIAVLLMALPACKEGDGDSGGSGGGLSGGAPAGAKQAPAKEAPAKEAPAKHELCTRLEGEACVAPATRFPADTPVLHSVVVSTRVPRKDGSFSIAWIAEDVGASAPKNYQIAVKTGSLGSLMRKIATHVTVKGELTRPTKGWPVGKYRVEVKLEGQLVSTARFEIEATAAAAPQ